MPRKAFAPAALLAFAAALFFWGLDWNLPSSERAELVKPAAERTDAWVQGLVEARKKIYWKYQSAQATIAHEIQTGLRTKQPAKMSDEELQHYYSGYLVRSGQGDEPRILTAFSYIKPAKLEFNPHLFMYGGPMLYPAGAFTFIAAKVFGMATLHSDIAFYYKNPDEMRRIFHVIRVFAVLLALLVVAVLYGVLERFEGSRFAAVTAALFAMAPAVLTGAHTLKPHLLMCAFFLLAVAASLQRIRRGDKKWTLLAGLFAGLAMGTSMSGLCVWFFLLPLHWLAVRGEKRLSLRIVDLAYAGAIAVAAYIAVNPYMFASWDEFVHDAFLFSTASGEYKFTPSPLNFLKWAFIPFRWGLSPVLWAGGLAALAWALAKGDKETKVLAGATLASLFWFGATAGPKWAVPAYARIVVPVCLMTMVVLDRALNALAARDLRLARAAAAVLFLGTAPYALAYDVRFGRDNPRDSQMMQAGRWLAANLKPGQPVGVWNGYLDPESIPPFKFGQHPVYLLTRTTPAELEVIPDWVIAGPMEIHPEWRVFLDTRYEVAAAFDRPVFFGWKFQDLLYSADYPVTVYKRYDSRHEKG